MKELFGESITSGRVGICSHLGREELFVKSIKTGRSGTCSLLERYEAADQ
jgi:hypothetical protein